MASKFMRGFPKHNISVETALDILKEGGALLDVCVSGKIELPSDEDWVKEIRIQNCIIEHLECIMVYFDKPVSIINSDFKKCSFLFSYFLQGLTIEDSFFESRLDFESGFHNKPPFPFVLNANTFNSFVNFFDCTFDSMVEISENDFKSGTNILGKTTMVTFDVPPLVENNLGELNLEFGGFTSETKW